LTCSKFDISMIADDSSRLQSKGDRAIVTVLGIDQIGIVAKVASVLADCGVNILDISQTLFDEFFAMNMLVSLSKCKVEVSLLKSKLDEVAEEMGLRILLQREDVFRFMHRV